MKLLIYPLWLKNKIAFPCLTCCFWGHNWLLNLSSDLIRYIYDFVDLPKVVSVIKNLNNNKKTVSCFTNCKLINNNFFIKENKEYFKINIDNYDFEDLIYYLNIISNSQYKSKFILRPYLLTIKNKLEKNIKYISKFEILEIYSEKLNNLNTFRIY